MKQLKRGKIQQFDYKRDFSSFALIEVDRFISPMNGMLTRFLIKKYGIKYWNVVDISGDQNIDAYLVGGRNEDELHIFSFAVNKDYEGEGWGQKLLDYTIKLAKAERVKSIKLEVRKDNHRAQHIYEKFGFKKVGIDVGYYDDGTNAIVMRLVIK